LPLYAYRCTQCGHRFEKIQNFSAEPELECPKCHGVLERPLTAPRLHFKGAGWYVNDYAAKSSESDSGSEAPSSENKSETKADTKAPAAKPDGSTPAPASAPAATPAAAPSSSTPSSTS
jgi:putative FmdB family regulatory protein